MRQRTAHVVVSAQSLEASLEGERVSKEGLAQLIVIVTSRRNLVPMLDHGVFFAQLRLS